MSKLINFIKRETVLCISAVLAILSVPAVRPSIAYLGYIDFDTISLLFCLMAVMAGLRSCGFFSILADKLLSRSKSTRQVGLYSLCCAFLPLCSSPTTSP